MSSPSKGFTLIELLIVIAIILILIAIALPNFLEAQIRARSVKSSSELRTYKTALESYLIDWKVYIRDHDSRFGTRFYPGGRQDGFTQLTTPIQYVAALPFDPFGANTADPSGNAAVYYEAGSGSDTDTGSCVRGGRCGCGSPIFMGSYPYSQYGCVHAVLLIGIGPDAADSSNGNDEFPYHHNQQAGPPAIGFTTYAPTNGTKSRGDIYEMTGDINNGYFHLDGRIVGHP